MSNIHILQPLTRNTFIWCEHTYTHNHTHNPPTCASRPSFKLKCSECSVLFPGLFSSRLRCAMADPTPPIQCTDPHRCCLDSLKLLLASPLHLGSFFLAAESASLPPLYQSKSGNVAATLAQVALWVFLKS